MNTFLINPYWLFGYDVVFNVVLTFITLAIAFYSFKAHKLSGTSRSKLFGISLSFYALAYLSQAVFGILSVMGKGDVVSLIYRGTYLHLFLFIIGTVTLAYMVSDIKKTGLYILLLALSLLPLLFFDMEPYLMYIIISTLLGYIFLNYALRCSVKKTKTSNLMTFAFGLLFISGLHLIFSPQYEIFYILGNILELISYIVLLVNLVVALTR